MAFVVVFCWRMLGGSCLPLPTHHRFDSISRCTRNLRAVPDTLPGSLGRKQAGRPFLPSARCSRPANWLPNQEISVLRGPQLCLWSRRQGLPHWRSPAKWVGWSWAGVLEDPTSNGRQRGPITTALAEMEAVFWLELLHRNFWKEKGNFWKRDFFFFF